jgi:glycosyltransferase involved in cell wall biosynthesis
VRAARGGGLLLERADILISLCMIVRDNARTIEAALRSIRPWVDEMIVIDTGSNDETPEICRRLGARVYQFAWCDDFAAARNESIKYARGRWIFWMDSDDTIDTVNGQKLRALVQEPIDPAVYGFIMQVHCPGPGEQGQFDVTEVDHVKLFRNLPCLRFERRIHEQIVMPIRRAGGEILKTDIFVVHSGYDHSPQGQEKKKQRDLHLLDLEYQDNPNDPFTLFNLGMTYNDIREFEKAIPHLHSCLAHSKPEESHLRKAYSYLVIAYDQLGRKTEAWDMCAQGLKLFPEDIELRFRKAMLLHESGCLAEAARMYEGILQPHGKDYLSSMDRAIQGFKARNNLAVVYEDMGDWDRAEEQWRRITEEVPGYRPGWVGLETVRRKRNGHRRDSRGVAHGVPIPA